ncbi:ABC transporter permease [Nakamurella sp. YIM 132084]|uniref:ABC transporter permease n=1 Tax=Nakamurella leprariae TaxID=2803911 RepID=A0A938YE03_9ACTN|nr:ABC transporter permease [Nakamurella leprariae]
MAGATTAPADAPAASAPAAPPATTGRRRSRWRWFARRPGLLLSIGVLLLVVLWAVRPGWFTAADPLVGVPREKLSPPSAEHWFGTDSIGRDLFARVVHGAQYSLRAVAIALVLALVVGALLGLISGYLGGVVDNVIMRVVDVLLALPGLLISLILITALGFGTLNVAIAVGVSAVAAFARVMRSEVLRVRNAAYVEAAVKGGVRWWSVMGRHVLPNSYGSIMALGALEFGSAILSIAALSFLGFGAAPPAPEWGALVADGRNYLATAWWVTTLPGLVVIVVVIAANRIGRALDGEWRQAR